MECVGAGPDSGYRRPALSKSMLRVGAGDLCHDVPPWAAVVEPSDTRGSARVEAARVSHRAESPVRAPFTPGETRPRE
jgi:hypothetical protein